MYQKVRQVRPSGRRLPSQGRCECLWGWVYVLYAPEHPAGPEAPPSWGGQGPSLMPLPSTLPSSPTESAIPLPGPTQGKIPGAACVTAGCG